MNCARCYESSPEGLAKYLLVALPPSVPVRGALNDWQTAVEGITAPSLGTLLSCSRKPHVEVYKRRQRRRLQ